MRPAHCCIIALDPPSFLWQSHTAQNAPPATTAARATTTDTLEAHGVPLHAGSLYTTHTHMHTHTCTHTHAHTHTHTHAHTHTRCALPRQVPYLEDPNQGVYLFESAAIVDYLHKTYAKKE